MMLSQPSKLNSRHVATSCNVDLYFSKIGRRFVDNGFYSNVTHLVRGVVSLMVSVR